MTQTLTLPESPQHLVLEDVSWEFYESLLKEIGDGALRVTYDDGRLEIMSPLPKHESWKRFIGRLIETLSLELDIPIRSFGSTTFKRKKLRKGAEPDECYYIQNESRVRGKMELSLTREGAPDLVVKVDVTSRSVPKEPIYSAFGVLEVWRYDGRRLQSLWRQKDGRYKARPTSLAFPWLEMSELHRFIQMLPNQDETTIVRQWQRWVREHAPKD